MSEEFDESSEDLFIVNDIEYSSQELHKNKIPLEWINENNSPLVYAHSFFHHLLNDKFFLLILFTSVILTTFIASIPFLFALAIPTFSIFATSVFFGICAALLSTLGLSFYGYTIGYMNEASIAEYNYYNFALPFEPKFENKKINENLKIKNENTIENAIINLNNKSENIIEKSRLKQSNKAKHKLKLHKNRAILHRQNLEIEKEENQDFNSTYRSRYSI